MSTRRHLLCMFVVLAFVGIYLVIVWPTAPRRMTFDLGAAQASEDPNVINLPAGEKLVNASVDNYDAASYLTRPMRSGETPETYKLRRQWPGREVRTEYTIREHAAETPAQNQGRQPK